MANGHSLSSLSSSARPSRQRRDGPAFSQDGKTSRPKGGSAVMARPRPLRGIVLEREHEEHGGGGAVPPAWVSRTPATGLEAAGLAAPCCWDGDCRGHGRSKTGVGALGRGEGHLAADPL